MFHFLAEITQKVVKLRYATAAGIIDESSTGKSCIPNQLFVCIIHVVRLVTIMRCHK